MTDQDPLRLRAETDRRAWACTPTTRGTRHGRSRRTDPAYPGPCSAPSAPGAHGGWLGRAAHACRRHAAGLTATAATDPAAVPAGRGPLRPRSAPTASSTTTPPTATRSTSGTTTAASTWLARLDELGLLCVPDLTWVRRSRGRPSPDTRRAERSFEPVRQAGAGARSHRGHDPARPASPTTSRDRRRQQRLVDVAELRRTVRRPARRAVRGSRWTTSAVASQLRLRATRRPTTPGCGVPGADAAGAAVAGPAVGLRRRHHRGPGAAARAALGPGERARRVGGDSPTDVVTDAVHDQLHLLGINVFRAERDGFRLTAARTLSAPTRATGSSACAG